MYSLQDISTLTGLPVRTIRYYIQKNLVDKPEGYVPTYPQVTVFSDKDMQTIKTLYANARSNGNHNVVVKLSDKLKTMMSIEPLEKPFEFVNRVIADYNYYTQQ